MIYLYDKRRKELTPCEETEFRHHGLAERRDLSKWVEQYPAILGEEVLILTTEYDRFDKTNERLDLLAIDKDGNLVIIELKRDDSGKTADLQAIKYAAYCSNLRLADIVNMYRTYRSQRGTNLSVEDAQQAIIDFIANEDFEELNDRPRIVLVARDFRPEVTASVLWLRKCGIDISCVKWDPYALADDRIVFNTSVLIPLPEAKAFLIQAEQKEMAEHTKTLTQAEYAHFFSRCATELAKRSPGEYPAATGRSYYQIQSGISCVHYEWAFHGRPRSSFGVELHCEKYGRAGNHAVLAACKRTKAQLEAKTGEPVIVIDDWGKRWSRMYVEKHGGRMTDDLLQWAVEKMQAFIEVLQPELDKIKKI